MASEILGFDYNPDVPVAEVVTPSPAPEASGHDPTWESLQYDLEDEYPVSAQLLAAIARLI